METQPSHVYYFEVGAGSWVGTFSFRVTSWRQARLAGIGIKNLMLAAAMALTQKAAGPSRLTSVVIPHADEGACGVVDNTVQLTLLRVVLYDLRERYVLDPDGQRVTVTAQEQFGPIPRIISRSFRYPAEIRADGLGSTYHMPLLGSAWTATYEVGSDRASLSGTLRCSWAEAHEQATRTTS